jgi:amidase
MNRAADITAIPGLVDWSVAEFSFLPFTEGRLYGPARNPLAPEHSTGGSSGGSAAAVAAGVVPIAHGNDGGGSIRIPASCCGLVGLKPTRARASLAPELGEAVDGLGVDFVLTRSVRDAAAALDAVAGNIPGDPYWAPPAPPSWLKAAQEKPPRLRIAVSLRKPDGGERLSPSQSRYPAGRQRGHALSRCSPPLGL